MCNLTSGPGKLAVPGRHEDVCVLLAASLDSVSRGDLGAHFGIGTV